MFEMGLVKPIYIIYIYIIFEGATASSGNKLGTMFLESDYNFIKSLTLFILGDSIILLVGICLKNHSKCYQRLILKVFITVFFVVEKN